NKTGIASAPERAEDMIRGAKKAKPSSRGGALRLENARAEYISQAGQIGTMPEPTSGQGIPEIFMDKLGEQLAFERSGTRLYETLVLKHREQGSFEGGPSASDLEALRTEEAEHFALLSECIADLGGDPTALTPSADLVSTEITGISKVVADPRTTLAESLHAMLAAELVDNEGWSNLVEMVDELGLGDWTDRFRR